MKRRHPAGRCPWGHVGNAEVPNRTVGWCGSLNILHTGCWTPPRGYLALNSLRYFSISPHVTTHVFRHPKTMMGYGQMCRFTAATPWAEANVQHMLLMASWNTFTAGQKPPTTDHELPSHGPSCRVWHEVTQPNIMGDSRKDGSGTRSTVFQSPKKLQRPKASQIHAGK